MHTPRCAAWLLAASLAAGTLPVEAGAPQGEPQPVPSAPEIRVSIGEGSIGPTCVLGESSLPSRLVNFITPPDDQYYMLLSPPDCPACVGTNRTRIQAATLKLFFPVACTVPVIVSVVGASGPDSCLVPNDNNILCAPQFVNLPGTTAGQIFEFRVDYNCEFAGKAFLCINFFTDGAGCNNRDTRPWLVFGDRENCNLCTVYNLFVKPPANDMCFDDPIGRPIMNAEVSSCFTPALPTSWGSLKSIYRESR